MIDPTRQAQVIRLGKELDNADEFVLLRKVCVKDGVSVVFLLAIGEMFVVKILEGNAFRIENWTSVYSISLSLPSWSEAHPGSSSPIPPALRPAPEIVNPQGQNKEINLLNQY